VSKENRPGSYAVGYGKPPKNSRFEPGRSGNPRGRPRGSLNLATILERELREKVTVDEGGQKKTMTNMEAAAKQLVNKATAGDLKAIQFLVALLRFCEDVHPVQTIEPDPVLGKIDDKVMLNILRRFEACNQGGDKDEDSSE